MKRYISLLLTVALIGVGLFFYFICTDNKTDSASPVTASGSVVTVLQPMAPTVQEEESILLPENLDSILVDTNSVPLDTIPSSITVMVNRSFLLPASYVPADLREVKIPFSFSYQSDKRKMRKEAAKALEELYKAGKKKKIELCGVSGYRSYVRQKQIYDRNVATRGKKATDTVSAMPGSSEHQTGLTMDISSRSVGYRLDQSFGNTKEGKWLAKNAHKFGYIIRYPNGKAKITGYSYEPWHIRYVGETVATYLYKNKMTLEEYYGVNLNRKEEEIGVDVEDPDDVKLHANRKKRKE